MINIRPLILTFFLSVSTGSLAACTLWDMIQPNKPGISVDTEITAGDKNQSINTKIGETTNNADKINITNIEKGIPFWYLILGVLGWFLPTPQEMWTRFKRRFKR